MKNIPQIQKYAKLAVGILFDHLDHTESVLTHRGLVADPVFLSHVCVKHTDKIKNALSAMSDILIDMEYFQCSIAPPFTLLSVCLPSAPFFQTLVQSLESVTLALLFHVFTDVCLTSTLGVGLRLHQRDVTGQLQGYFGSAFHTT